MFSRAADHLQETRCWEARVCVVARTRGDNVVVPSRHQDQRGLHQRSCIHLCNQSGACLHRDPNKDEVHRRVKAGNPLESALKVCCRFRPCVREVKAQKESSRDHFNCDPTKSTERNIEIFLRKIHSPQLLVFSNRARSVLVGT